MKYKSRLVSIIALSVILTSCEKPGDKTAGSTGESTTPVASASPTPEPSSSPSPTPTQTTPAPVNHSLDVTLPEGYQVAALPDGFTQRTESGKTRISGQVADGASLSFTATSNCFADINYSKSNITANLTETLVKGVAKKFPVYYYAQSSSSFATSKTPFDAFNLISTASSPFLECGNYSVAIQKSGYMSVLKDFQVDGSSPAVSIYVTLKSIQAVLNTATPMNAYIGSHDDLFRRIILSVSYSTGDIMECSFDGSTYQPCANGAILFPVANINANRPINIRVKDAGGFVHQYALNPYNFFPPNTKFFECTDVVASDIHFIGLMSKIQNDKVICLAPALNITAESFENYIDASGKSFKIVGSYLSRSKITNARTSSRSGGTSALLFGGTGQSGLYNLEIVSWMTNSNMVKVQGSVEIRNSVLRASGENTNVLILDGADVVSSAINSTLVNDSSGLALDTTPASSGSFDFTDCTITSSKGAAIRLASATKLKVLRGSVSASQMDYANNGSNAIYAAAIYCGKDAEVTLSSTSVETQADAIEMTGEYNLTDPGCKVTTNGTAFKYKLGNNSISASAFNVTGLNTTLNSSSNGNTFCGYNVWESKGFFKVVDIGFNSGVSGTFVLGSQPNSGVVSSSCNN